MESKGTGEQFFLRMVAYIHDKPKTAVGMRMLINEIIEEAYHFARGQDVPDRFKVYGTNQNYWRGRSEAALAVRKLKSKVPDVGEEHSEPDLRKRKGTAVHEAQEGAGSAPRGGSGGEGQE